SKHDLRFDEIYRGEVFPFKYDRRHDLSIVLSHDLSERWSFSGAWIYGTGNAYSIPDAYFPTPNLYPDFSGGYGVYSQKNNFRMLDYQRMDISLKRTKERRRGESTVIYGW